MQKRFWLSIVFLFFFGWTHTQPPSLKLLQNICDSEEHKHLNLTNREAPTDFFGYYDLKHILFDLWVNPDSLFLEGSVTYSFTVNSPTSVIEFYLDTPLTVDSVYFNGSTILVNRSGNYCTAQLGLVLPIGSTQEIRIAYHGTPNNSGFGSIDTIRTVDGTFLWTLSQPYGAQDWWPSKNDLNDKIDSITVQLKSPAPYFGVSNGLLVQKQTIGDTTITIWKHNHHIANYLIAIASGNYAQYNEVIAYGNSGDSLLIENFVFPQWKDFATPKTAELHPVIHLFDSLFGTYPFLNEKYGHTQFGWGGGMEHQTNSFVGTFDFELLVHEYAHMYFGDLITCASWPDLWLNEGFATYLTAISYEHLFNGKYWPIWKTIHINGVCSQPDGSVFPQDTTQVSTLFNSRLTYSKAALLLHMIRFRMGDEAFYKACNRALVERKYDFISTQQFIQIVEEECNCGTFTEFLNDWYFGEGYPSFQLEWAQLKNNTLYLELSQSQSNSSVEFFETPIAIQYFSNGIEHEVVVNHVENNQVVLVPHEYKIDSVFIDKNQWLISANNTITNKQFTDLQITSIFPNPVENELTTQHNLQSNEALVARIFTINGQLVHENLNYTLPNAAQTKLNVQHLQPGTYTLQIFLLNGPKISEHTFIKL